MKEVKGTVKWYNQFKGYGFIDVEGLPEDVFVHFSVLEKAGLKSLMKNDVISFSMAHVGSRFQAQEIHNVLSAVKFDTPESKTEVVTATMKWFNPSKGFGFAQLKSGEDVFIHSNLLRKASIKTIEPNKEIKLKIHHTNFGYEALDILKDH